MRYRFDAVWDAGEGVWRLDTDFQGFAATAPTLSGLMDAIGKLAPLNGPAAQPSGPAVVEAGFDVDEGWWRAAFGGPYRPLRYGKHSGSHPATVREVLERLRAGQPCPEAADVIAALAHRAAVARNVAEQALGREETDAPEGAGPDRRP